MRPCFTQHPGPVLVYVAILHLEDGSERECAPCIDYTAAEALGQLHLHDAGVVGFAVQTRLAERGTA